ncbi:PmbA [Oceaniovalibus guishaninsula JLT2003]|uniref:PmbA n=1 Tax=Oceaniovalibus guishaninsula JLT2003 TaxID=1231392 RepID=K2I7B2_9RHOB|nr:TldD/PmbA family protein [Oceaniovalibus guishaninsula]EKE44910.1 PmbA [Oceaniovalibus guishaninsula JLT2003]
MPDLDRLTADLLAAARRAGAEAADVIAADTASLSIDVRKGALEHAERSEGVEIGLRVLMGRRQACVSASDISPRTMQTMAERAVAMAREAPEDPGAGLADPDQLARDRDMAALELADPADPLPPAELEDWARRAEAAALAVKGVSQVQGAGAGQSRRAIRMAATNGFRGAYERTDTHLSCVAISGDGLAMERDYAGEGRVYRADLPSPEEIGALAGDRAAARAGARKARTGAWPVIFDERVAGGLIGHLLQAVNGTMIARGSSWARDLLGQPVLPDDLSLIEEPHRCRIGGSRLFDAEGLPTARRAIVENGILTGWTLDLATGRKLGMASTANAARGLSSPPAPVTGNVTLTGAAMPRDRMLAELGTGLLVTSMIGSSINPNTGDYSRGASGFWVENGEIGFPVNEITLAGNLRDMLRTLAAADDARPWLGRVVPSLRVEGLVLAGE